MVKCLSDPVICMQKTGGQSRIGLQTMTSLFAFSSALCERLKRIPGADGTKAENTLASSILHMEEAETLQIIETSIAETAEDIGACEDSARPEIFVFISLQLTPPQLRLFFIDRRTR